MMTRVTTLLLVLGLLMAAPSAYAWRGGEQGYGYGDAGYGRSYTRDYGRDYGRSYGGSHGKDYGGGHRRHHGGKKHAVSSVHNNGGGKYRVYAPSHVQGVFYRPSSSGYVYYGGPGGGGTDAPTRGLWEARMRLALREAALVRPVPCGAYDRAPLRCRLATTRYQPIVHGE